MGSELSRGGVSSNISPDTILHYSAESQYLSSEGPFVMIHEHPTLAVNGSRIIANQNFKIIHFLFLNDFKTLFVQISRRKTQNKSLARESQATLLQKPSIYMTLYRTFRLFSLLSCRFALLS